MNNYVVYKTTDIPASQFDELKKLSCLGYVRQGQQLFVFIEAHTPHVGVVEEIFHKISAKRKVERFNTIAPNAQALRERTVEKFFGYTGCVGYMLPYYINEWQPVVQPDIPLVFLSMPNPERQQFYNEVINPEIKNGAIQFLIDGNPNCVMAVYPHREDVIIRLHKKLGANLKILGVLDSKLALPMMVQANKRYEQYPYAGLFDDGWENETRMALAGLIKPITDKKILEKLRGLKVENASNKDLRLTSRRITQRAGISGNNFSRASQQLAIIKRAKAMRKKANPKPSNRSPDEQFIDKLQDKAAAYRDRQAEINKASEKAKPTREEFLKGWQNGFNTLFGPKND